MRVGKIMIRDAITVSPETSVLEAIKIMQELDIRHLPVVRQGNFAGWLSSRDLYQVMLAAMLEEITVGEIMNTNPISVTPETGLEEAAHLIREHKIGGVPVLSGRKLVGVLTVIDLLSAFLFMLEALQSSSRLDVALPEDPLAYEEACRLIREAGGEIINVGLGAAQAGKERIYAFRLARIDLKPIIASLKDHGVKVVELVE
ncbi:CBS domain-containing protein [Desulfobacca acetoxidans]|uniref:CBS domain containing protein n=1 Tax=Desulfobacca acetoxidans (strain ATCC 700848 / DSM 11109 / ASRB2) TaxID=880072 RepID=F2NHU9_DESAR|nr:CBS domain-containing protein [Desulfobacca acetoxidans]AEB09434.1 CBS domain containing protein [Desulfobacca acetoxidans DSM 11109]